MEETTKPIVLKLKREPFQEDATRGVLHVPWGTYHVLERPWLDNSSGVSCIPEGTYECKERWSNHLQRVVFGLKDVPGRNNILIHNGSYIEHSLGCLLIGKTAFSIKQANGVLKRGIGLSRMALDEFMQKMNHIPFLLEITREGV